MNKWKIVALLFAGSVYSQYFCNAVDYGDVPSPYLINHLNDDARHTLSDTYLGFLIDEEEDNATYQHFSEQAANKDDLSGVDDEDGIIGLDNAPLISAATNEYQKTVTITVQASRSCRLSAWIDWNIDNQWTDSEKIISDQVLQAGSNSIDIAIPTGESNTIGQHNIVADTRNAGDKKSYARFRCTTDANVNFWGLASNGEVEDYSIEINALGHITGQIYKDTNFNSIFDTGDQSLPQISIELLDNSDNVVQTTTTDSNGVYRFIDVVMNDSLGGTEGYYKVQIKANQAGAIADLYPVNGLSIKDANISEVARVSTQDFQFVPYGEIGQYAWVDLNENKIKDTNEPPLQGVTIILNNGHAVTEVVTDANGYYQFPRLIQKGYSVIADIRSVPAGFTRTTTDKYLVEITSNIEEAIEVNTDLNQYRGRIMHDANFGYKPIGVIGDLIWKDENTDKKQDYFEKGIQGVLINLLDNNGTEITSATTDVDGKYLFTGLMPGSYIVEIDETSTPLNGLKKSNVTTNRINVTLDSNSTTKLDIDVGFYGDATIGNYVWKDLNEDGVQNTSEPGIEDVTLSLYHDSNRDGEINSDEQAIENTTTDIQGFYSFTNLEPNNYIIQVTDLNDKLTSYIQTTSSDKVHAPVHAVFDLRSGQSYNDADFGYKPPLGSIGDCVWDDKNMNKIKDTNEENLEGIWIKLHGPSGMTKQVKTKKDCTYFFEDLAIGTYSVEILKEPKGFSYTTKKVHNISLKQGENYLDADFGLYKTLNIIAPPEIKPPEIKPPTQVIAPPTLPTRTTPKAPPTKKHYSISYCAWHDKNQDGEQNQNEEGLNNVWIKLTGGPTNINKQVKTDKDCNTSFDDLPNGQYRIEVIAPPYNYKNSTPESKSIILNGRNYENANFGYYKPSEAPMKIIETPKETNLSLSIEIPQTGYNPERAAEGFSAKSIFPEITIKNPYYEYVLFLYVEELLEKENILLENNINFKDGIAMLIKGFEITEDKLDDQQLEELLKKEGILTSETKFILHKHSLDSPITYERALLVIARLSRLVNDENKVVKGHWQENYYQILNERNLIPDNFKNNKNWQQVLTRGEFFSFAYRVIQRKQSETKSYINKFSISMPNQNINNVPTRRTLLSHPDIWVEKLKNGAAFYEDKENDRLIVFAHSSNFPGETNPIVKFFGNIFKPLIGNVSTNDRINLAINNYQINYRVISIEKVAGHEISALKKKDDNDLIVFTCDKDPQYRWIIRAKKSRY